MSSERYQRALCVWLEPRLNKEIRFRNPPGKPDMVVGVTILNTEEGGWCINDTCWFEGSVRLSFICEDGFNGERTYLIEPGTFVSQVAAIYGAESESHVA